MELISAKDIVQRPELHERKLRLKTGEYYDYYERIVPHLFDLDEWARSFGKRVIYARLAPIDAHRSHVKCCVASGQFATPAPTPTPLKSAIRA